MYVLCACVLTTHRCTLSKDDMEGSGGVMSNGLPGVSGPEGRQVSERSER